MKNLIRKIKYWWIFNSLKYGDIAVDCGANVGNVVKRMAKNKSLIYAFEPNPFAFKELKKNCYVPYRIEVFNKAVSDYNGKAKLYFHINSHLDPLKWSTGSSMLKMLKEKSNVGEEGVEVEVVRLADFLQGRNVTLLKIDIGGEEVRVLNDLLDRGIAQKIKYILVETHERIPSLTEPMKKLRERVKGMKNIDLNWA